VLGTQSVGFIRDELIHQIVIRTKSKLSRLAIKLK